MAITKYSLRAPRYRTWRDFEDMSNRLSRFFEDAQAPSADGPRSWAPAVNVAESREDLVLTAELPGLTANDVTLEVENNVLTISGEKTEVRTEGSEDTRFHVWERSFGSFHRTFTLPRSVRPEDITAVFDNGVLTVTLPKAPEAKGRTIEIAEG